MWLESFYSVWDVLLVPVYIGLTLLAASLWVQRKGGTDKIYRYFIPGLMVKIAGGLAFTAVYTLYYHGGDCHAYFWNTKTLVHLLFKDAEPFFSILAGNTTPENRSHFDYTTGFPTETMYQQGGESFAVSRFMVPFALLGGNHMLLATILLDVYAFWGIWRFYQVVSHFYPGLEKKLAIAILFIPSVAFWGSGIMKDVFALTGALWASKNIISIFLLRKKIPGNLIMLALNIFTLISIKPYVIVGLIPCMALAVSHQWIRNIKNPVLSTVLAPSLIAAGLLLGLGTLSLLSKSMGTYSSFENIASKAQINQQDLIRAEQYGGHSFNIGSFDASFGSMVVKAPKAIIAGLFRPFLWEAGNAVMLISGIENTILLFLAIYILFKTGPIMIYRGMSKEPIVMLALTFSLIFAFSVGLSTANFGALVRYKIPGIPFFATTLAILWSQLEKHRHPSGGNH